MAWYWWLAITLGIIVLVFLLVAKRLWLTVKYKDEDLVDDLLGERRSDLLAMTRKGYNRTSFYYV